jgi:phospholipid/cholesterol/gamma-HCH transport system substrate-binding protein
MGGAAPLVVQRRKERVRTQTVGWRRGTAASAVLVVSVASVLAIVLLATSAGGSNGGYTVRAIFDDAANVIPGEDVKIDGVKVGTVGSVVPTPKAQAAITIKIANPGFQDFRADASCTIKPQALIGEKYVDCLPTQARAVGTPEPPPLGRVPRGQEGAGERLLPVQNTSSPVDVDQLQDITRRSESERLTIIINELGAGLAGRGSDLREVIQRADPALRETTKVIGILAGENKILAKLAVDSDQALAPLARARARVADFISQSNSVARTTAEHRGALAQNLAGLAPFLHQLAPAMQRLGKLAEQTTPVFTDLGVAAPGINRAFTNLAPFSKSSTKFFQTLGKTAQTSGPALTASQPLLARLEALGGSAKPFAGNLSGLLSSLRETGGIERLMDFIFLGANSTNGYDALGHFLRASVVGKNCIGYAVTPTPGCSANFFNVSGSAAKASSENNTSVVMARTLAVLDGESPAQAIAKYPGSALGSATGSPTKAQTEASLTAQPVGGASAGTTYYTPSGEGSGATGALLNYLLGN